MSEIKYDMDLTRNITLLANTGGLLNQSATTISADGVSTLDAAVKYIEQHKQIKEIINLYKKLIIKDAADLSQTVENVKTTDLLLSNSLNLSVGNIGGQK
ncbi:MAG: hypothetical protein U0K87_09895 [Ruminococcus sp.]|nr:hypothetical protein [Ruminococcus sp.]